MAADLADITKTEHTDAVAFADMKDSKMQQIHSLAESIIDKTKREGGLALSLAQSKDALEDAEVENGNAQKYLNSLSDECATKAADMATRAEMRTKELSAVSEAIKILNEDDAL